MSQYVTSPELTSIANLLAQEVAFDVAVSLLVSELLFTVDHEVDFVWKRLRSGVSYVFLFNRYFPLLAFSVVSLPVPSPKVCAAFASLQGIFMVIMISTSELMLILRVYAVSLRGRTVLAILLVVWMSQITLMTYGLSLSGTITISPPVSRHYRCIVDTSSRLHSDFLYYFIVPTLAFDTVAFLLTFLQLYEHVAIGRRIKETPFASYGPRSISSLILRDGFAYFLALCIVNIAWAISSTFLDPGTQNLLGFPNAAITVVLINRMFLHTRYFSRR